MSEKVPGLDRKLTLLLSFICAVTVGNLYLIQPLLAQVAAYFHENAADVGTTVTLGQAGYGLGVLLIVPLGDRLERRSLMLTLLVLVGAALCLAGTAANLTVLSAACLLVGVTTIVPQIVVPYAASLADPLNRASVIGTIQSGLLIGILLARTVSGGIASLFGWRVAFFTAAGLSALMFLLIWRRFPKQAPTSTLSYPRMLGSMFTLFKEEPALRKVSLVGGANFAVFSVFWTTLAFLLEASFHFGPAVVGLFGIVGVVGALAASFGGKLSDRKGTAYTQKLSLVVTLAAFLIFAVSGHSLVLLIVGVIVLDAGVQANHIACQAEAFSLRADARSRLNGIYMFFRFLGGALGSLAGSWCWHRWEWTGVCWCGVVISLGALGIYLALAGWRGNDAVG